MARITRRLDFDYGHRVLGHESKCARLHGHRGVADITVDSLGLDSLGRVIDFSQIKLKVGKWIDEELDHNMLLHPDDPLLLCDPIIFAGKAPFIMPAYAKNPTAENIAHVIFDKAVELLNGGGLSVYRVRVWETPNCHADHLA